METAVQVLTSVARKPIAMLDHASQPSALVLALVQVMSLLTAAVERMARPAKGPHSEAVALPVVTAEPSPDFAVPDASKYRPAPLNRSWSSGFGSTFSHFQIVTG
jgi:hypothetical protein